MAAAVARLLERFKGLQRLASRMSGDVHPLHETMVDDLKQRGLVRSARVEAAFRAVPRHLFLPALPPEQVYRDDPIVTLYDERKQPISSSSQPAIMAIMLEMLALAPGQRVLEIGAGTGYNAALMAAIVGEQGTVVAIDIDHDIVVQAVQHLAAAGFPGVRVLLGDGAEGCEAFAPFDRIILTVGAGDIAPAWRDQLRLRGRLVLPLTLRCTPRVVAFERTSRTVLRSVQVALGGFMPLRGIETPAQHMHNLPQTSAPPIWNDRPDLLDLEAVQQALAGDYHTVHTGVYVDTVSSWSGWGLWLELHDPAYSQVYFEKREDQRGYQQTVGLIEGRQVALVAAGRRAHQHEGKAELIVHSFGSSERLAGRLVRHLRDWQARGSPRLEDDLHIAALPAEAELNLPPDALRIVKRHMQYVVEFFPPAR